MDVTNRALTHATQFSIRRCMGYMKQDIGGHFLYKNVYRRALEWSIFSAFKYLNGLYIFHFNISMGWISKLWYTNITTNICSFFIAKTNSSINMLWFITISWKIYTRVLILDFSSIYYEWVTNNWIIYECVYWFSCSGNIWMAGVYQHLCTLINKTCIFLLYILSVHIRIHDYEYLFSHCYHIKHDKFNLLY